MCLFLTGKYAIQAKSQHQWKLINPSENRTGCLGKCIMGQLYSHIHQGYSQDPCNFQNWNQHGSDFPGRDGVIWLFSGHRNAIGKRLAVFFCGPDCCHRRRHGGCSEIPFSSSKKKTDGLRPRSDMCLLLIGGQQLQAKATASEAADQSIRKSHRVLRQLFHGPTV